MHSNHTKPLNYQQCEIDPVCKAALTLGQIGTKADSAGCTLVPFVSQPYRAMSEFIQGSFYIGINVNGVRLTSAFCFHLSSL